MFPVFCAIIQNKYLKLSIIKPKSFKNRRTSKKTRRRPNTPSNTPHRKPHTLKKRSKPKTKYTKTQRKTQQAKHKNPDSMKKYTTTRQSH
jgi:hypothetical protein